MGTERPKNPLQVTSEEREKLEVSARRPKSVQANRVNAWTRRSLPPNISMCVAKSATVHRIRSADIQDATFDVERSVLVHQPYRALEIANTVIDEFPLVVGHESSARFCAERATRASRNFVHA